MVVTLLKPNSMADLNYRCGPRKLAKVLNLCLDRAEQSKKDREMDKNSNPESPFSSQKPSNAQPKTSTDQHGNIKDGEDLSQITSPPSVTSRPAAQKSVSKTPEATNRRNGDQSGDGAEEEDAASESNKTRGSVKNEKGDYQFPKPSDPEPPFAKPLVVARSPLEVGHKERDAPLRENLHGLLVDDNKINLRLLVTLMRKINHTYEQAENGQEALSAFKASSGVESPSEQPPEKFDFICMDIGRYEHRFRPTFVRELLTKLQYVSLSSQQRFDERHPQDTLSGLLEYR